MKRFFLLSTLFLILSGLATAVWGWSLLNYRSANSSPTTFVVNRGDSLLSISRRLAKTEPPLSPNFYLVAVLALTRGLDRQLQAGVFTIPPSSSPTQIVDILSQPGSFDYWWQILPGSRLEEISISLPVELNLASADFLALSKGQEGRFFPEKYKVPLHYSPESVLALPTSEFDKQLAIAKQSSTLDLSDSQSLILASMLEREAKTPTTKQTIAGIILNRLAANMPLQIDATVQYARDSRLPHPSTFWLPPTKADLTISSPYNTYLNPGLPPGPICSPGSDSLYAAYHTITTDYYYYISDSTGQMHYARTLDEHNANIAKYLR